MAISHSGTPTVNHGTSTSPSVTAPGGSAGDRSYFVLHYNVETTTVSSADGKSTEYSEMTGGGYTAKFAVYTRTVDGGEPATYTWTLSSSQRWSVVAWTVAGMDTEAAFHVAPSFGNFYGGGGSVDDVVCPAATTTVANCRAYAVAGVDSATASFDAYPSGWTEVKTWEGPGDQPLSVYYKDIASAGTTGSATFSKEASSENAATLTIFAVAPAGSGGGNPVNGCWVGVYYPDVGDVASYIAKGVTRFHCYEVNLALMDEVLAAGGKAWVEVSGAFPDHVNYNQTNLDNIVNAVKNHPALEGYFTGDEPDLNGTSLSGMISAYNRIHALDTNASHLVAMAVRYPYRDGSGGTHAGATHSNPNGYQYLQACDVVMLDYYVFPFAPNSDEGVEVERTVNVSGGRLVRPIIGLFSWGDTFGPNPDPHGNGGYPNTADSIEMGVSARENGADDLWIWVDDDMLPEVVTNLGTITAAWGAAAATLMPPAPHKNLSLLGVG